MVDVMQCKNALEYLAETKNVEVIKLLRKKWAEFKDLITILQFPYKATIALQKRDLTLSDTFGIWLKIRVILHGSNMRQLHKTDIAECLLSYRGEILVHSEKVED